MSLFKVNQHIYVAVRIEVLSQDRAKEGKLGNMIATTEVAEAFLIYLNLLWHWILDFVSYTRAPMFCLVSHGVATFTTGLKRTDAPSRFARTRTRGLPAGLTFEA